MYLKGLYAAVHFEENFVAISCPYDWKNFLKSNLTRNSL